MKEVWILHLTWAADWPREQTTAIHGVYTTWPLARAAKDDMLKRHDNKDHPGITAWSIKCHEVEAQFPFGQSGAV